MKHEDIYNQLIKRLLEKEINILLLVPSKFAVQFGPILHGHLDAQRSLQVVIFPGVKNMVVGGRTVGASAVF
jgi:hypothetical protein